MMNMMPVITMEKLGVYESYAGDKDAYARSATPAQKAVFGDDADHAWERIRDAYANLEMIGKGITTDDFSREILTGLEAICDKASFGKMTYDHHFYKQFQSIGNILVVVKSKIHDDSDTVWAGYDSSKEVVDELDRYIDNIRFCSFETLENVSNKFLPTGAYQELAVSNGWGDLYLGLAEDFEAAYTSIRKAAPVTERAINYELYTSFAEATVALINMASEMTTNHFSTEYTYILSEIKESNKDAAERRKEMLAANKKKKPLPLEELLPLIEKIYDNVYDFNLHIYKAEKATTIIDIRYYPKLALEPAYRITVQGNKPMMHCKVSMPPGRKDNEKFDINWEHQADAPWWKRIGKKSK